MQAELDGEVKPVIRHRRGVMWCPFCDRSSQDRGGEQYCDKCRARFTDDAVEPVQPRPRRNRRAEAEPINLENADAVSDVAVEAEEEVT